MSESGSMTMELMPSFVKHVNKAARKFVPPQDAYVLCLDGHSSRKGIEWIEECLAVSCEAVISPANTSHFLQPCDQEVNKKFKEGVREMNDAFRRLGMVDTRQVNFNLACAVHGFERISSEVIKHSFRNTGVYPFWREFPLRFRNNADSVTQRIKEATVGVERAGSASRVTSLVQRRSDTETLRDNNRIIQRSLGPSQTLQQISLVLKNAETVNSILMTAGSINSRSTRTSTPNTRRQNYEAGAPAEYVTHADFLAKRREDEAEELRKQLEKERGKLLRETERVERVQSLKQNRLEKAREREPKRKARQMDQEERRAEIAERKKQRSIDAASRQMKTIKRKEAAKLCRERVAIFGRKIAHERKAPANGWLNKEQNERDKEHLCVHVSLRPNSSLNC